MGETPIRYFHYLSSDKIDEAYGQIPQSLVDRLRVQLRLPLIPVAVDTVDRPPPDDVHAKVDLVAEALNAQGQVGSIPAPRGWFRGTMTMRWGCFGRDRSDDRDVIFFIGKYADITVALGGSAHNGKRTGQSTEKRPYSNSGWQTLMDALHAESIRIREAESLSEPPTGETPTNPDESWEPTLSGAHLAWPAEANEVLTKLPGRGENVEFVAKWLDQSDYINDHPVLLGTPLFVASAVGISTADTADESRPLPETVESWAPFRWLRRSR